MVKNSKLFRFIAVLGIALLAIYGVFRLAKEYGLTMAIPIADIVFLFVPFVLGTVFFTVGICGIMIGHRKLNASKNSKAANTLLVLLVAFLGNLTLYYILHSYFSALEGAFLGDLEPSRKALLKTKRSTLRKVGSALSHASFKITDVVRKFFILRFFPWLDWKEGRSRRGSPPSGFFLLSF